jgi:hypothetical protein
VPASQVDRRGFIVTALGAGFALAVQPSAAQSPIKTDTDGLTAGEIKVRSDGEMVAYRAMPAGKSASPVVLVVSEIFGVHEYIADVCRRLAKEGYLAIAPELFARYGDPRKLSNIQEILTGIVAKVPDAGVMSDLDACVAWAGKKWRRCVAPGDHRLLLGRAHHLAVCRAQPGSEGRRRLVRPHRWRGQRAHAEVPARPRGPSQGRGARPLRLRRPGHPAR